MQTLLQKLQEDMKTAMKGHDAQTLDVLRMAISSVKNKAMELNKELSDADIISVLASDAKKLKDALDSFVSAAREDLAKKAEEELAILQRYLPEQLSDADLEEKVRQKVTELGIQGSQAAGKAMGLLVKELQGIADGSRIKAALDKILEKNS